MSFVDLATLTLHHRHEMEGRISTFAAKCDQAINSIRKLKTQSRTFVDKLNCEPSELKVHFLACMNKLDEYIYLMTEFNLSIDNLEKKGSMELAPVHDTSNSYKNYPVLTPTNLMDVLSEPTPTVSTACPNMCPAEKPHIKKRPKVEQLLISFSSASCSAESVPESNVKVEKEVQCVADDMQDLAVKDPVPVVTLPAQDTLDTDKEYEATVMSINGADFWIAVHQVDDGFGDLIAEMSEYYELEENRVEFPIESLQNFTCCVYHDADDTGGYYRALFVNATEGNTEVAEVFLVDTGECRAAAPGRLQPLAPAFSGRAPYARLAHCADVEVLSSKTKQFEDYLKQFVGKTYVMKIDDNTSESLGVYLFFEDGSTLNELLVREGFATALDKPPHSEKAECPEPIQGPPEMVRADSMERLQRELEYGPEHDNPVEAVTGYNSRDEKDICKYYKGGPDKTCFKGLRCTKKHVLMHPDGWTRDRVAVTGKCRSLPLPAPGTWHKVTVTYVCHFDRLYVHFDQKVKDELPSFGVVLPPTTLPSLVRDMNSPATYAAFKPLKMAPAPGELVAARYRDGYWYRARVICSTRADQSVELIYIDYGNVISVKENEIMELDARFTVLPAQAVLCRLAGIAKLGDCSKQWAAAKSRLTQLAQDQTMEAQIIARGYDEITVEMFDSEGYNLAQQLAAGGDVAFDPDYCVEHDSQRRFQHVLP